MGGRCTRKVEKLDCEDVSIVQGVESWDAADLPDLHLLSTALLLAVGVTQLGPTETPSSRMRQGSSADGVVHVLVVY